MISLTSNFQARCAAAAEEELLPKELEIPLWDESYSPRAAVGYKDNVLLNAAEVKGSGFFESGLDVTVFRLTLDDWEFHFLLTGDDRRYWRDTGPGADHEDLWAAIAEGKKAFGDGWKAGLAVQYAYLYQVVDPFNLLNTTPQSPFPVEGHTIVFRPSLEKELGANNRLSLEMEGIRQFLGVPGGNTNSVDSFFRFGPRLTLARAYGNRSELSLSYAVQETLYDHETDANPDGTPVPETSLRALKHQATLGSKHYWDERRRWESGTKLTFGWSDDNGSGYFSYRNAGVQSGCVTREKTGRFKARPA